MSCAEGVESAGAFWEMGPEVMTPDCGLNESRLPRVTVTDCKSLFDTVHREGVKAPSERRLIPDPAALRQSSTGSDGPEELVTLGERRCGGCRQKRRSPMARRRSWTVIDPGTSFGAVP